jgi:hypothetical protein
VSSSRCRLKNTTSCVASDDRGSTFGAVSRGRLLRLTGSSHHGVADRHVSDLGRLRPEPYKKVTRRVSNVVCRFRGIGSVCDRCRIRSDG